MVETEKSFPYMDNDKFRFVTVAPKKSQTDDFSKLKAQQELERKAWRGIQAVTTGLPQGMRERVCQSDFLAQSELRCRELLERLQTESDYRPPLLTFMPVQEHQLLREAPPVNLYTKGNFLQQHELLYRVYKTDARLVRSTLEACGFHHTDSHDWNLLWLGSTPKPYLYEGLNEYQKLNHFPSSSEITRKDRLCCNLVNLQHKFGTEHFDFIPDTYILPDEFADFYTKFQAEKAWWIIKPCASSQGKGIYIIDDLDEVPIDESLIISRYIANPLLIKGLKFDLRIYVLVTCFEPLRIYMFEEGLARFASEPYRAASKASRFMHLTNYSVNKKNSVFVQNLDYHEDNVGHKWSMSALFKYLEQHGVDVSLLWSRIYDMIIKTILAVEPKVVEQVRKYSLHRSNCFDLYGFDVLIDSELKPWLMEVNLSPSLGTESPLDLHIKGNLIADTLNLVGIRVFDRRKEGLQKVKARLRAKQVIARRQAGSRVISPSDRSDRSKLKEYLKETLEEYERRGHFLRIYPSSGTDHYDQFFTTSRRANQELYLALYERSDISWIDRSLESFRPETTPVREHKSETISRQRTESRPCKKCRGQCNCKRTEKLVITGDDILMEYIARLMHTLKTLTPTQVRQSWRKAIEKFVTHYVWLTGDSRRTDNELWQRLEARLIEMKERRRRLLAASGSKPSDAEFDGKEEQKLSIIRGFSASQLEEMLRTSTKNVAQEVVSCLIGLEGRGVLTAIIKALTNTKKSTKRAASDAPTDSGDEQDMRQRLTVK